MSSLKLRHVTSYDLPAIREICIATGDAGEDARKTETAPELLPLIFAEPYFVFSPECAFLAEDSEGVCGYVLGTPDTAAFEDWVASKWFPAHRKGVPDPGPDRATWGRSDWLRRWIHAPIRTPHALLGNWPGHGHIDFLPRAQGTGAARALMERLTQALAEHGARGLHVGVDRRNLRAQRFYEKLGFRPTSSGEAKETILFVRALDSS